MRADNVRRLTAAGWQAALDHGVRRLVDLRFEEERLDEPDAARRRRGRRDLALRPPRSRGRARVRRARSRRRPTSPPSSPPATSGPSRSAAERVAAAVAAVADSDPADGVVIHCFAGKDRTGIVSALLLGVAGVPDEIVAADYAASEPNMGPLFDRWIATRGRRGRARAAAEARAGRARDDARPCSAGSRESAGGAAAYLRQAGLTEEQVGRLRAAARRALAAVNVRRGSEPVRRRRRARGAPARPRAARAPPSPPACSSARASSQSASAGLRGSSGPWRYVPIAALDATAFESRAAVVAVPCEHAPERGRAGIEQRPAGVVLEARHGRRDPVEVDLEQHVADQAPLARDRLEREDARSRRSRSRRGRGSRARAAGSRRTPRGAPSPSRRLAAAPRPGRRGRARRAPARDPGRRRRRSGRTTDGSSGSPGSTAVTSSAWPRSAARRAKTAMLPRSA